MIGETSSTHSYRHMLLNEKEITRAYFIGIGGIGMSALAQLMKDHGVRVMGSDREESPVTELLVSRSQSVSRRRIFRPI